MKPRYVPYAWAQLIDSWASFLAASGRTNQTIETRREHVRRCARQTGTETPTDLTEATLLDWAGAQTWAPETRRSTYASLRSFWRWAAEYQGLVDITERLPSIKATAPCPVAISEQVYRDAILSATKAGCERSLIAFRLAGEAGLRRAEICQISVRDLVQDLAGWSLLVHGKGQKLRLIPLSESLAADLRAFVGPRTFAFESSTTGLPLTPRSLAKICSPHLPEGVGLHRFRHRFSATVYQRTRDLAALQVLLGHASLATTQRYVPVPTDALRAAVMAAA